MISIQIADKPSNSKGWARYAVTDADGRRVVESRTGNEWVSADHSGDAAEGERVTLRTNVMLRVGKGFRAREEKTMQTYTLVVQDGATCQIIHKPGSQGIVLDVQGARLEGQDAE